MIFSRRKKKEAKGKYRLKFRAPITFKLLERACLAIDVSIDRVIDDPKTVLDELDLTVSQAQGICDVVLRNPPKLRTMKIDRAMAIAYYVVSDFFLHTYMGHWKGRIFASLPSTNGLVNRLAAKALL